MADISLFSISVPRVIKRKPPAIPIEIVEKKINASDAKIVDENFTLCADDLKMDGDLGWDFKRKSLANAARKSRILRSKEFNVACAVPQTITIDMTSHWDLSCQPEIEFMVKEVNEVSKCTDDFVNFYDTMSTLTKRNGIKEGITILRVLLVRSKRVKLAKYFQTWLLVTVMLQFPVETIKQLSRTCDDDNDSLDSVSLSGLKSGRKYTVDDSNVAYSDESLNAFSKLADQNRRNKLKSVPGIRSYEGCEVVFRTNGGYRWKDRRPTKLGSKLEAMQIEQRKRLLELEIDLLRTSVKDAISQEQYDKAIRLESEALSLINEIGDNADTVTRSKFVNIMYRISEIRSMSEVIDAAREKRLLTGWVYPTKSKSKREAKRRLAISFK